MCNARAKQRRGTGRIGSSPLEYAAQRFVHDNALRIAAVGDAREDFVTLL